MYAGDEYIYLYIDPNLDIVILLIIYVCSIISQQCKLNQSNTLTSIYENNNNNYYDTH